MKTKNGEENKWLGSGDVDYSLVAIASKSLGNLTLHAMLEYKFVGDNGDNHIRNIYLYALYNAPEEKIEDNPDEPS